MTAGLVTFGETMALLISTEVGPLRHATGLELRIGGSESNVAIGVRRLGHPAAWAGRVGDDEFGALVLGRLRGEQVDVSAATTDASRPTGLMVKATRTPGSTQVIYYRAGSAASRLAPEHLDEDLLRSAAILHVTGITAALSPSAREAAFSAVEVAAGAGVPVSFDPNHRSKLWSADVAAPVYRDLASRSTVVLAGADEAAMMVGGSDDPGALLRALVELCPGGAVLKQGQRGRHGARGRRAPDRARSPRDRRRSRGSGGRVRRGLPRGAPRAAVPGRAHAPRRHRRRVRRDRAGRLGGLAAPQRAVPPRWGARCPPLAARTALGPPPTVTVISCEPPPR
jgi:2-dehydro-3-deoxygluconokinase